MRRLTHGSDSELSFCLSAFTASRPPISTRHKAAASLIFRFGLCSRARRELGELLGATQKTVDYYERRTLNPTLDVIQKVAEALEVSPAQLIGDGNGLMKINRKTGPTSKVQKAFEVVSTLPRRQQEKIIDVVTAMVRQYEQSRL